jgi:diguanylate cyclase (GGDEF)-like protein
MSSLTKAEKAAEKIRVLVVEDEEPVRRLISTALKREGFETHTATHGRSGLQALLRNHIDVVITDLVMREMDGLAFLQEARKIWPWLRFIICSGYIDVDVKTKALDLGVTQFISKPIDLYTIIEAVRQEARNGKTIREVSDSDLFNKNQYQLNLLRQISESALKARSLQPALQDLCSGLTRFLSCDLVGVLVLEKDESLLHMKSETVLKKDQVDNLQKEIIQRYRALTAMPLDTQSIRIEVEGPLGEEISSEEVELKTTVMVPVISGGEVRGILALADRELEAFSFTDVSFLYHAAHHLSTLLAALGQMRQLAVHDHLTGLFNRRQLEESLERTWLLSRRYHHSMALMEIDLDQFKPINDTLGHLVGDKVLLEVARVLQTATRSSDILGRFGGDEFLIILQEANQSEAVGLAERINQVIRDHVFLAQEHDLRLTASIGVAMSLPDTHTLSYKEIVDEADKALYQAKEQGRDCFVVWNSDLAGTAPSVAPKEDEFDEKPSKGSILIVDDDPSICRILEIMLREAGHQAIACQTVPDALVLLKSRQHYDIVLADLKLPGEDGFSLLEKVREMDNTIVRIVITGHVTAEHAISALRHGSYDFIRKPFNKEDLLIIMDRALEYRRLILENLRYRRHLEEMVRAKSGQISEALDQIKASYQFTLEAMVAMLDARERELSQHSQRVRDLTVVLARHMGVQSPELEEIGRGALLHDIGKIAIPDAVLQKPGALDPDEWEVIRNHPQLGYSFLASSSYLKTAAEMVLSHHEHYDGRGYPRGLKGEEICLGARIFAVIDAYDAMRSRRVYKTLIGAAEALDEIQRKSGTQFDPKVVQAFTECQDRIEELGRWPDS